MVDIAINRPVEFDLLRIGELVRVETGCDEISKDGVSFSDWLCGCPVSDGGTVYCCAKNAEGWSGEAESVTCVNKFT